MSRPLPGLYAGAGVGPQSLAGVSEFNTASLSHIKLAIELLLQVLDSGADGGLCNVQAISRFLEAAGAGNLQEGTKILDIHGAVR